MTSPFDMVCMLYTSKENVDIPNTYPLHKVYMGLIKKRVPHPKNTTIFPMNTVLTGESRYAIHHGVSTFSPHQILDAAGGSGLKTDGF